MILDSALKLMSIGYIPPRGQVSVEFEFLAIGEEFVPKLCGLTKFDPVWVASLADIAVMKAYTYQDRGEDCDYEDLAR